MNPDWAPLAEFAGVVRLFPLPNFVLFPHAMQPLHIFEPRYRQMTADALVGDRLIAMVLPRPGWEQDYGGAPPTYSVATIGKIMADQKLDDGRYNLLLRGLGRIQLIEEVSSTRRYRRARAELLVEAPPPSGVRSRKRRKQLLAAAAPWLKPQDVVLDEFRKLLEADLPLGVLADLLAFALPLDIDFKQCLLEELDVDRRARRLLEQLQAKADALAGRPFPPEFSVN
jgi:uncharacterized protein